MNEYEKLFYSDIREKKITATGAKHRASRGKRAVTVHHHSDYLTEKQRKELSSPVITFKDKPLTRNELKTLSKEEQKSYFEFLIDKYNVTAPKLSVMLECSASGACFILKELGVENKQRRMSREQESAWEAFLDKRNQPEEPEEVQDEPAENISDTEEKAVVEFPVIPVFSATSSITLQSSDKEMLKAEVARAISFVLPDGHRYKVTIEVL